MPVMPRTNAARVMADRLCDGNLAKEIVKGRKLRAPWTAIAEYLGSEYGVVVTGDTLSVWARELGIDDEALRAEAAS